MTVNLPRGKFIQVTGRPTQDNTGRQAQAAQSGAEAFASDGSNIQFGPINPDVLPIATSSSLGVVEPDNVTITVDPSGIISAVVPPAGGPAFHPGHVTGRYYTVPFVGGTTVLGPSANTLYAMPVYVPEAKTYTAMGAHWTIAAAAGKLFEFGVYSNVGGQPSALEFDAGSHPANVVNDVFVTGLSMALSAGWHWLVFATDGAPNNMTGVSASQLISGIYGQTALTGSQTGITGPWTFSAGALPSSFPAKTYSASTHPLIWIAP